MKFTLYIIIRNMWEYCSIVRCCSQPLKIIYRDILSELIVCPQGELLKCFAFLRSLRDNLSLCDRLSEDK